MSLARSLARPLARSLANSVVSSDGGGANPLVGGYRVGDEGAVGSIYEGYTLSWAEDFTGSLDIVSPMNPNGKYFTTRTYAGGSGPRNTAGLLAPQYNTDPYHTGHNDYNRGVPMGYDNLSQSASVLTLQCRLATAGERNGFDPDISSYAVSSMICLAGAICFYPGSQGTEDIIVEAYEKFSDNNTAGWHPTDWLWQNEPSGGNTGDEHDDEDAATGQTVIRRNVHTAGSISSSFIVGSGINNDNQWYLRSWLLSQSASDGVKCYKDGTLRATGAYSANTKNLSSRQLFTSHVDTNGTEGGWDSTGENLAIDYVRVWRRTGKTHYSPLTSVANKTVAFGGSTTVTLPSKTALWGNGSVTEYVQMIQSEVNDPYWTGDKQITAFPTGISYDSGTRVISITAPAYERIQNSGPIRFSVHVTDAGTTCEPLRFYVDVLPHLTQEVVTYTVGGSLSFDLYAVAHCGSLTTNGTSKAKTISVSGLPAWASYSDSTGLITNASAITNTGTSTLTVTVTDSLGNSDDLTLYLANDADTGVEYSTAFTAADGDLATQLPVWTRVSGNANDCAIASNSVSWNSTTSTGALYTAPALDAGHNYGIEMVWNNLSGPGGFCCLRVTDVNNYIGFRVGTSGEVQVFRRVSGSYTSIATTDNSLYTAGTDTVALEDYGDYLILRINGTRITEDQLASGSLEGISPTSPPAANAQGMNPRVGASASLIDDWRNYIC